MRDLISHRLALVFFLFFVYAFACPETKSAEKLKLMTLLLLREQSHAFVFSVFAYLRPFHSLFSSLKLPQLQCHQMAELRPLPLPPNWRRVVSSSFFSLSS